jgi:hypothetical protein
MKRLDGAVDPEIVESSRTGDPAELLEIQTAMSCIETLFTMFAPEVVAAACCSVLVTASNESEISKETFLKYVAENWDRYVAANSAVSAVAPDTLTMEKVLETVRRIKDQFPLSSYAAKSVTFHEHPPIVGRLTGGKNL